MKNNGINISEWVASLRDRNPFYLAIINEEGLLTFTNSRFYTHFVSRESTAQHNFFDLVHQGDRVQLKNTLVACSAQEDTVTTEIRVKNSHSRWIKWEISCLKKPEQAEKFLFLGYDLAREDQLKKTRQALAQNFSWKTSAGGQDPLAFEPPFMKSAPDRKGVTEAIIKAKEDERTRIGHELHDNINQILASGQLYLNLLNTDTENFQEIKDKTLEILQLAIEEIRVLSRAMVVPDLKDGSLVANIHNLVNDLRFVNIFDINFSHSKSCELELLCQNTKISLFRIVQEQTKNIVKYSKAQHVDIAVHIHDDRIRLEIKDDGQGFDTKSTKRGLGLSNIYERTRFCNGMVMLNTAPGKGCSIIVNIPFRPQVTLT
jgi:signal transduction histidine kinase